MWAEVLDQPGVEQGCDVGTVSDLAPLPGVQGKSSMSVGEGQLGSGESGCELGCGDKSAAFGPGRVGGEYGRSDSQPVEWEGAAQLR
jgi:hypothetical protein